MDNQMLGVAESPLLRKASRGDILAYILDPENKEISPDIRVKLTAKDLRLSDRTIYSIKPVTGKTIKMFETQDVKEVGLRNVDRGRLPKEQIMVVSQIRVTAAVTYKEGTVRADDDSLAQRAKFYPIDYKFSVPGIFTSTNGKVAFVADGTTLTATSLPVAGYTSGTVVEDEDGIFEALENGEFDFLSNKKTIISEMPLTAFKQINNPLNPTVLELANPRIIGDDSATEFTIDLGQEVDSDGENVQVWVKVELIGTGTIPA